MGIKTFLKRTGVVSLARRVRMVLLGRFVYRLKSYGPSSYICRGCVVRPNTCSIGRNSWIGSQYWLRVDDLRIGNYVLIASRVAIVGGDHQFDIIGVPTILVDRDISKPVIIEDDVWIGYGATIMHGAHIGEGPTVAARALVTRNAG